MTMPLSAQSPASQLLFVDTDTMTIQGRAEASFGVQPYRGSWFNLLNRLVPSYNPNRTWGEGWFAPGVDITLYPGKAVEIYAGLSIGFSGTWGSDLQDRTNQGAVLPENVFAGVRTTNPSTSWNVDLSVGQQNYGVGTGMLLWQGAQNGFERGADFLTARTAWSNTAIARFSFNGTSVEAFYLDPNEVKTFDTGTTFAGGAIQHRWSDTSFIGLSYLRVLTSTQFYPLARFPFIIENGRDGLEALQGFAKLDGTPIGLPNAWVRGEFALERNSRIDMRASAYYGEIGYRFATLPFAPTLSYGYATFSGDDPNTPQYERFDPLFYGNGQNNWEFGSNSSYAFQNTNVNFNRVSLQLTVSKQDSLRFQYIHTRANELLSGAQLGPLIRFGSLSNSLTIPTLSDPHLADEIYGEWNHNFKPNVTGTLWASITFPGAALRSIPNVQTWASFGGTLTMYIPKD